MVRFQCNEWNVWLYNNNTPGKIFHFCPFILQDYSSPYDILLSKVNLKSLFIRRLQNFMITLYKSLFFTNYPGYLKDMFTVRSSSYNLRGNHILALPNPKTTTYGQHFFSYVASKIWNSLPDTYKTWNFQEFKQKILIYEAFLR